MITTSKVLILQILLGLALTLSLRGSSHQLQNTFCWRDSYGRGVGAIPPTCPQGTEAIGLLCYDLCPQGMYRFVLDCHSVCPEGLDDNGLFCRRSEYGRGSGYAWWVSDGFSGSGMMKRCEADNGEGNCEQYLAMVYPKCQEGYYAFGCCICRPNEAPDCQAYGLNPGIDLSCAKVVIVGTPQTGVCEGGQEKDGGLCYQSCNDGFFGVGPVCWGNTPQDWTACGMGVAKDQQTCSSIVWDQVASVGSMALSAATFGASTVITNAAKIGRVAEDATQLKKYFQTLQTAVDGASTFKTLIETANDLGGDEADMAAKAKEILNADTSVISVEDIMRISANIAALADPTGIAGTVGSFTYPKCSALAF